MSRLSTVLKALLIATWFFATSIYCFLLCLWRWRGNRNINPDFARLFGWGVWKISGVRGVVQGRENARPGQHYVIVANHQSELDLGILGLACPPDTVIIGKKELLYVPFFGVLFAMTGNLLMPRAKMRQAVTMINNLADEVRRRGVTVFIFPEGTRNKTDEPLLPFKKGPFHLAIRAGTPILPIVSGRLKDHVDFGRGILKPGVIPIRILEPFETRGLTDADIPALMTRVREKMLEALRGLGTTSSLT